MGGKRNATKLELFPPVDEMLECLSKVFDVANRYSLNRRWRLSVARMHGHKRSEPLGFPIAAAGWSRTMVTEDLADHNFPTSALESNDFEVEDHRAHECDFAHAGAIRRRLHRVT